jgi:hypothetical protein
VEEEASTAVVDSAVEGSTAEDLVVATLAAVALAVHALAVAEVLTSGVLPWEHSAARALAVLGDSAIPLARGQHMGDQSM